MVLQTYTFAGLFMSAPLAEYTISGSYSSDRLRGAHPKGSPRRLAVADRDVSSHQTTTKRHVHDSAHFYVPVSGTTFRQCITWHCSRCAGHIPRDTYTIRGIFVYVCPRQRWHHALQGTVAGIADNHHETRTRFRAFLRTCVPSGQQSSARTAPFGRAARST